MSHNDDLMMTNDVDQATTDLKNYDVERHESFKQYEMQKALEEELEMKKMNEFEKKQYLEDKREKIKTHNKHEKMPHPVRVKSCYNVAKIPQAIASNELLFLKR